MIQEYAILFDNTRHPVTSRRDAIAFVDDIMSMYIQEYSKGRYGYKMLLQHALAKHFELVQVEKVVCVTIHSKTVRAGSQQGLFPSASREVSSCSSISVVSLVGATLNPQITSEASFSQPKAKVTKKGCSRSAAACSHR